MDEVEISVCALEDNVVLRSRARAICEKDRTVEKTMKLNGKIKVSRRRKEDFEWSSSENPLESITSNQMLVVQARIRRLSRAFPGKNENLFKGKTKDKKR